MRTMPRLRALLLLALVPGPLGCGGDGDTDGDEAEAPTPPAVAAAADGKGSPFPLELSEDWIGGDLELPALRCRLTAAAGLVRAWTYPRGEPLPDNVLMLIDRARSGRSLGLEACRRPNGTLDDLFRDALEELRLQCPGFQLLGAGEVFTRQGLRGRRADFQWLQGGRVLVQRQILFVTTEAFFTLTATWPPGGGPGQPDPELEATLESFDRL